MSGVQLAARTLDEAVLSQAVRNLSEATLQVALRISPKTRRSLLFAWSKPRWRVDPPPSHHFHGLVSSVGFR